MCLQIPCPTLHDVINALVEKTAGTLQPFLLEEPYEENISMSGTCTHSEPYRENLGMPSSKQEHAGAEPLSELY